jgi:hypothetical protein
MANLILNGSTSGSVTLSSPAVSGTTTLTLPATSGTVLTSASNTNFPAGSVLQVVQASYSTSTSTTSTSFVDTGLTASITPASLSNKILIIVNHPENYKADTNAANAMALNICRSGSQIVQFNADLLFNNTVAYLFSSASYTYLDSPSSTSSVAYKTQFKHNRGGTAVLVQGNSMPSTITLMEIKG